MTKNKRYRRSKNKVYTLDSDFAKVILKETFDIKKLILSVNESDVTARQVGSF